MTGLLPVALLGFTMFARWIGIYRTVPAERRLPVPVVLADGLLATTTRVMVLLTAIGIGGS